MSLNEKTGSVEEAIIAPGLAPGSISNTSGPSATPMPGLEHARPQGEDVERRKRKKLVQKLDTFVLPVLILMCLFQAVDKGLLG